MPVVSVASRRELASLRLAAQRIAAPDLRSPGEVVRWMLAMQAQDFPGAKWSIGLRMPGALVSDIELALETGEFVRSWPMRGTLHFIAGEDLGWMLGLTTARQITRSRLVRERLGLTENDIGAARDAAIGALSGGRGLERSELLAVFDSAGISTAAQRGYHLLAHLAQIGLLVFGPVVGKRHSFVLLDEWVPRPRRLEGDEALAELAARYFRSHGPATVHDLSWWASVTMVEARAGLALSRHLLDEVEHEGVAYYLAQGVEPAAPGVFALPGFDEFMLGYKDRSAALAVEHRNRIVPGNNGVFLPTMVSDGQVVGTWRRREAAREVAIELDAFGDLSAGERSGFSSAIGRYGEFLGRSARVAR